MSSGGMSWQQYNGHSKYQMPPPNTQTGFGGVSAPGGDMQDMHLKMSKKIAQLTKVIYALNTKNDEHEAAMLAIKESHEEESQQIIAETTAKIQQYRLKIGNELDLRKKIENLEQCITANEQEKRHALNNFENFKTKVEEENCKKEAEHAMKVFELTKEMLETRAVFEQRMQEFQEIKQQIKNKGGSELIKIQAEHRNELERLNNLLSEKERLHSHEKSTLITSHEGQTNLLNEEIDKLRFEFKKSEEEHNVKMIKAKAFFENEMKALKSMTQNSDEETGKKWLEREANLKMEASKIEMSLRNSICQLQSELAISKDENEDLIKKVQDITHELKNSEQLSKELQQNVSTLRQECENLTSKIKHTESELTTYKEKVSSQTEDILQKSSMIGTLEASKLSQDTKINNFEREIKKLKTTIEKLNSERDTLQSNSSLESQQLLEQMKALQNKQQSTMEEKSNLVAQFTKELKETQDSHKQDMVKLNEQFDAERRTTEQNHQSLVDSMKEEAYLKAQSAFDNMLRDMQERYKNETNQLLQEKNIAVGKITDEKTDVEEKLKNTQEEVRRLADQISHHESGLGTATSHITSLKAKISDVESQLKKSNKELRLSQTQYSDIKTNMEEMRSSHTKEINELMHKHRNECDKVTKELNDKWHTQLRHEVGDLEKKLTSQYSEEKRKIVEDLNQDKNREMEAAKSGWQGQIQQLTSQLSDSKHSMELQQREFDKTLANERNIAASMERELRQQAQEAANEYASKISSLEDAHRLELASLEHKSSQENRSLEAKLISQHREELQSQMMAHRAALEAIRDKLNRERAEDLNKKEQETMLEMDELRGELSHQHAYAIDEMQRQNEMQLNALQMDLQNTIGKLRQQEIEYTNRVEGLESDLKQTTTVMNSLQDKLSQQNSNLTKLNRELDYKGKELLQVRSEATSELRRREEDLERKHRREQDANEADNLRQKQSLVNEFNRATDSLKDKISALSIALQEAEEMYKRRESRPEDLRAIEQLRNMVHDKELQMQKLIDDKKYYQMELVNRETNFNKVFNASPNVGVMNPLTKNKKKGSGTPPSRFTSQFVSVPNLSTIESAMTASNRLEPIRAGSSSPANGSVQNGLSKTMQPTPPNYPKKFLRINSYDANDSTTNRLEEVKGSPRQRLSSKFVKIPFDEFENSLKEFDDECKHIENLEYTRNLSGSCSNLNQLDFTYPNNKPRRPLARSCTMPPGLSPNYRKYSTANSSDDASDISEDEIVPNSLDDVIDAAWARNRQNNKRFKFSSSVKQN